MMWPLGFHLFLLDLPSLSSIFSPIILRSLSFFWVLGIFLEFDLYFSCSTLHGILFVRLITFHSGFQFSGFSISTQLFLNLQGKGLLLFECSLSSIIIAVLFKIHVNMNQKLSKMLLVSCSKSISRCSVDLSFCTMVSFSRFSDFFCLLILINGNLGLPIDNISCGLDRVGSPTKSFRLQGKEILLYCKFVRLGPRPSSLLGMGERTKKRKAKQCCSPNPGLRCSLLFPCSILPQEEAPLATSLRLWGRLSEREPRLWTWNKPFSALMFAGLLGWYVKKEAMPCLSE